jgi:hypothetical protein
MSSLSSGKPVQAILHIGGTAIGQVWSSRPEPANMALTRTTRAEPKARSKDAK